jgi:hypothetical protein
MDTHDIINSQMLMTEYIPLKFSYHNRLNNINKDIQHYLNDNNINLEINTFEQLDSKSGVKSNTLYIRNFSDNIYYEIYISNKDCPENIYKLDIIRCIVRNDDWIANHLEMSIYCDKKQIIEHIKSTNIEIDSKLYNLIFNALCP